MRNAKKRIRTLNNENLEDFFLGSKEGNHGLTLLRLLSTFLGSVANHGVCLGK